MKISKKAISSKNTKNFLCVLMALVIMLVPMGLAFASAESNTFRVSTSEEFVNAIKEINAGSDDAEYVIEMLNDITITNRSVSNHNASLEIQKGITTIYGNNFVLSSILPSDSLLFAAGNSVVNLGSADEPEKSKLFFNASDSDLTNHPDFLGITDSATANVYEGVVFQNNSATSRPGGAISVGEMYSETNATLNMYGGIIRNCQDTFVSYGGAVFVGINATFNMYGGTIENNNAGIGGGICNLGTFTMEGGVVQNNTATDGADDIFSQGTIKLNVAANAANGFGKLAETDKQIKGWFEDGNNEDGNRWDVNNYCIKVTNEEASAAEAIALKAAHDAGVTITFDVNSGDWNDTDNKYSDNADNTYSESLAPGANTNAPVEPTKPDYKFLGWYTEDDVLFDFASAVDDDVKLHAKWEYNNYKNSVTLDKTYIIADGYTGAGDVIESDGKLTEDITLKIVEYKSFNREGTMSGMPAFEASTYKFKTGMGADEIQIALPDFSSYGIGDYWYKVTENGGKTAGVTYDTTEYYMHIVVTRENDSNPDDVGITQVTFHKNAPAEDGTYTNNEGDKATGVTNAYGAGTLTITTDIKGNFADRTKTFDVVVTFAKDKSKTITGDIYYSDGSVAIDSSKWKGGGMFAPATQQVKLTLGLGDTVTFTNIPDGVTYTITESDYSADGYENPVFTFDNADETGDTAIKGNAWADNQALGTISDSSDIVTIINAKNATIDVGVFLENAPFVALILLVVAVAAVMIITRRRRAFDAE